MSSENLLRLEKFLVMMGEWTRLYGKLLEAYTAGDPRCVNEAARALAQNMEDVARFLRAIEQETAIVIVEEKDVASQN